jgi:sigma-B regulation protein RsbU (phosphoserine phosphatase)
MMSRVRQVAKTLGTVGISFIITLAVALLFYFTGHGGLLAIDLLALIPLGAIMAFRAFRHAQRQLLWSLRNRLLFVYGLFGVLPLLLLFVLIGLGTWSLMSELAIYLASSALDRRLQSVHTAVDMVHEVPADARPVGVPHIVQAFHSIFPGIVFYIRDATGEHAYPSNSPPIQVPPGWKNVNGLLFLTGHFYAWAHRVDDKEEITALAPLSDETIADLVPNLGVIALVESPDKDGKAGTPITAGAFNIQTGGDANSPNITMNESPGSRGQRHQSRIPPPVNQLDLPIAWPSTRPHFHLDRPGQTHPGVLWVQSRPSAVLSTFFSGSELLRGLLLDVFIAVAILFLIVELVALVIGISLSRRITRAVNNLYEGTRRVIHGDFRHRIPVRFRDQLGELGESFNQMTGNLERLLSVEKEKERLQTELEIAREVQTQLYPKEAPPSSGLKLTVECDPARMVSGDYYDYEEIANGKIAFAIGDVAGKGISAALLMATLQATLRAQLSQYQPARETECSSVPELDTASLVSQLNQQLYAHTSPEKYATFFFALFDENTRSLTYTNAGHLSPLLFRNGHVVPLGSNGTVVGAFPFSKYNESCLTIEPRDLLVCYTDGVTEPENAYGEMFGEERLIDLVKKHAHRDDQEIIRIVLEAVRSWTVTPELHDDMTLLLARQVQAS